MKDIDKKINGREFMDYLRKKSDLSYMQQEDVMQCLEDFISRMPEAEEHEKPRRYLVIKPGSICEVMLLPHKTDGTWSFINLTKGHICSCKFPTLGAALNDMDSREQDGKIAGYWRID